MKWCPLASTLRLPGKRDKGEQLGIEYRLLSVDPANKTPTTSYDCLLGVISFYRRAAHNWTIASS